VEAGHHKTTRIFYKNQWLLTIWSATLRRRGDFYFREATLKALFLILASDSGKRFGADDWSLNPNLEELRGMAPEVFPQL